ncbi:CadD family cadmium resistance transporter [Streptococcus sp. CSL10205-OR2]|uniref:CadD family cadmium resistance transporter n=1 Tax=Streptococcus sp. CSL10205-OR2 TaxID=2980558 RepID=UPI0021D8DA06|nr:CadD family cadmium resistance transporter [Streptococcus sp. CSL10205-OR2]MCU9533249.1 CadD family cadmium resistance transporter [Streptococcus sp. CSL10205-OR2]
MFQTMMAGIILYSATAIDLIIILLIFFGRAKTKKQYRDIYLGQYLGSLILMIVSLFFAYILGFVPQKWLLGFLGIIPIYFGVKTLLTDNCAGEENAKKQLQEKGLSKLLSVVALVVLGSCGADNIGLFVPYFVTLNVKELIITLFVFIVLMFLLAFSAHKLSDIPIIGNLIEKYGVWIMGVVYISLGVFIIFESQTLQTLFNAIIG